MTEKLIAERLLIADRGEVYVAHEALLRRWDRAVQWIEANREVIHVRDRVAARMVEGAPLTEADPLTGLARHHLASGSDAFTPEQRDYIAQQLAMLEKSRRRRERVRRAVVGVLSVLTLAALAASVVAWMKQQEAREQAVLASTADLASAIKAWQEDFDAIQKGQRAPGFRGRSRWHEAVALLTRSLERDPTNQRAQIWLHETIFHPGRRKEYPLFQIHHEKEVSSATFSPDGTRLVTASWDHTARIWDVATGKPIGEPLRHEELLTGASFSPDGSRVVTASADMTARIWDAATGKSVGEPLRHRNPLTSASFSPDGTRVVTTICQVLGISWSPDGSIWRGDTCYIIAAGSDEYTYTHAQVWDVATGKPIGEPLRHKGSVKSANFSPDGSRVVTASEDKTAQIWDAATGRAIGEPLREVHSAIFSPDSARVVTAGNDKTTRIWDAATGKPIGKPLRHEKGASSAGFNSDGTRVVTTDADWTIRIWDAATGKLIGYPFREEGINRAIFSPDGSRLVTTASPHETGHPVDGSGSWFLENRLHTGAQVWDVATNITLGEPLRHEKEVSSASFSPDGSRVVTDCWDETAQIWDSATGRPIGEPLREVNCASFSSDSARVVTVGNDKTTRIWDAATGQPIGEPIGEPFRHKDSIRSASFSPDGSRVVTASADMTARIWDAATGKSIGEPLRHEESIHSASFSPDGTRVVTACGSREAGYARVWDATTGKPIGEPLPHEGEVHSASFSPDGSRVVTGCWDGTARICKAPPKGMVAPTPAVLVWANALTGFRFRPDGELEEPPFAERHQTLSNTAALPTEWKTLAEWVLDRSPNRLLHPGSRFTVRQIAERERDFNNGRGTVDSLTSAMEYDSTLPLTRLLLANAWQEADSEKEDSVGDATLPARAAHLRRYDLDRLPNDPVLWTRAALALNDSPAGAMVGIGPKAVSAAVAALAAAEKALELKPEDDDAKAMVIFARGRLAFDKENWKESAHCFCECLQALDKLQSSLFGDHVDLQIDVLIRVIESHLALKDYPAAFMHKTWLTDLGRKEPVKLAEKLLDLATMRTKAGNYADAFLVASEAWAVATKAPEGSVAAKWLSGAGSQLCWYAELNGKFAEALSAGEKAVSLLKDDKASAARMNLAHAYLFTGRFDKAKDVYAKYLGHFSDGRTWNDEVCNDFKLLRERGHVHPDMKKIEAMIEEHELANGLLKRAEIKYDAKDYHAAYLAASEAWAIATKAREASTDTEWLSGLGCNVCWYAAFDGKFQEGVAAGEKAVALLNDDKPRSARINLAHAYLFTGRFDKAKEIYTKYLGQELSGERKWNDVIRDDFKLLREAGRDHPDMKKIEAMIEESAKPSSSSPPPAPPTSAATTSTGSPPPPSSEPAPPKPAAGPPPKQ